MYYYEVNLGVDKHWKSSVFTYQYEQKLEVGMLVRTPFGRSKKIGRIVSIVEKPDFKCKTIEHVFKFSLSKATKDFMLWFKAYYNAEDGQVNSQFLPSYLTAKEITIEPGSKLSSKNPSLSDSQTTALRKISKTTKPSVLHGITGSGKTRIYVQLLIDQLRKGKNALLLYPEISLTSQIVSELEKYLPVVSFHSKLTNAQRSKLWYTVASRTEPIVIVGPRSSLFLPHKKLGIIIIDEAHDSSFKQENDIRYSAIYTAAGLAKAHGAKLLLGSATPPVAETKHILNSSGALVCIHEKAIKANPIKEVLIVDAKNREEFSRHPMLSNKLLVQIQKALDKKEQILLFINRRGTAKLVLCSSDKCDWQAECDNCDLPLTYHHDLHRLVCHTCGKKQPVIGFCPVCNSETRLKSLGSKAIVEDIEKLFQNAKIGRFDSDTILKSSFHENYGDIRGGSVDILIGTQQLVKGLDLPKLSTVGILNADLSLHFPDFSSDERTFQLIAQVMGRVGRGHTKATVIVQTFQPSNPVIQLAQTEDWHKFWDSEIKNRQKYRLPPFVFYVKLLFRETSLEKAENSAKLCAKKLESNLKITVDGPIPSFYLKRGGHYYMQLHIKSKSRSELLKALKNVPKNVIVDLDPATLL